MALKGMSTTLVIIVAAIVILITALVVITIFGGGMQNFLGILNPWASGTTAVAQCQGICQQLCLTYGKAGEPSGWSTAQATHEGELNYCKDIMSCSCADFNIGPGCGTRSITNCAGTDGKCKLNSAGTACEAVS